MLIRSRRFWLAELSLLRPCGRGLATRFWLAEFSLIRPDGDAVSVARCRLTARSKASGEPAGRAVGAAIAATSNTSVTGVRTFMVCISFLDDRGFRSSGFDGARGWLRPDSGTVAPR